MKQKFVYALSLLLLGTSSICRAGGDLDDISIQVIGLEEIPEEALEHIPLPGPGNSGLPGKGIILNRAPIPSPITATPAPDLGSPDAINNGGGGGGGGGAAPPNGGDATVTTP